MVYRLYRLLKRSHKYSFELESSKCAPLISACAAAACASFSSLLKLLGDEFDHFRDWAFWNPARADDAPAAAESKTMEFVKCYYVPSIHPHLTETFKLKLSLIQTPHSRSFWSVALCKAPAVVWDRATFGCTTWIFVVAWSSLNTVWVDLLTAETAALWVDQHRACCWCHRQSTVNTVFLPEVVS